jgi:hypothetical protein
VFCVEVCEERAWAREAEESPLLEAVDRERLKAQQAGKAGYMVIVEVSGGAGITCSSESCL